MSPLDELVQLLSLERLETTLFRGPSQDLGWGTVYGGQVLGQALSAAYRTVPSERSAHSLHAYFLRPGQVAKPVVYDVNRIRDGGSFTTRRVVAIQDGEAIFNCAVSFQKSEPGFEHQTDMPEAPAPETVPTEQERMAPVMDQLPPMLKRYIQAARPFELRLTALGNHPTAPEKRSPQRIVWMRTNGPLPDTPWLHQALLAYASDYAFLTTALLPHGVTWLTPGIQITSLDHVMYFHAPFRIDDWLLHVIDSPRAAGARGLVQGRIYTREGRLIATTTQEGLIRNRAPAI